LPRLRGARILLMFAAIEVEGVVDIHATDVTGVYATLCGLDGDDPTAGQKTVKLPKNPRITCETCLAIIRHAKEYKVR